VVAVAGVVPLTFDGKLKMAKLILSMDGVVLKEIPVIKERMSIGRKPHNDIQIDNLAISGEHAVIVTILNDSFLEDLNSTNGTFVNGHAVKKHFLKNDDLIELGKYRIKFTAAGKPLEPVDYEKTVLVRPEMMHRLASGMTPGGLSAAAVAADLDETRIASPVTVAQAEPGAPLASGDGPCGVLRILSGVNVGRELTLVKKQTTLGKPGVQVARITREANGYVIDHVQGVGFPLVNGKLLDSAPRLLQARDLIQLAGIRIEFQLSP
jgi:pSer/pThr/pTyr-binding forkhead associated (FHA) protein